MALRDQAISRGLKLLFVILIFILLAGCSLQYDKQKFVENKFPDAKIYSLEGKNVSGRDFIVRNKDGKVYFVSVGVQADVFVAQMLLWEE